MTTTSVPELTARIEKAERNYRRLRNCGFVVLACIAVVLLMGLAKPQPRIIEADAIVLRDESGRIRARLDIKDDMQAIALYDKRGTSRSELSLAPDGSPLMWLYDEGGKGRVLLGKGFGDSWSLGFFSSRGTDVAQLGVDFKGIPYLYFYDKDGKKIWSALPLEVSVR